MRRVLKALFFVSVGIAIVLGPASPAAAKVIYEGERTFANPDELADCPLAEPAFSGTFSWQVYFTHDPSNPAAELILPANTDTFTVVIEVTSDALLNLPAECSGGPHTGDPNPASLSKLNVGTYNLGYGNFLFLAPAQYGTIDDGNPATPAPSGSAFTYSSVEFYFDSPNIAAGETTQKVFFTIPSIEPGETTSFFLQATTGATDDESFVPLPFTPVPVEEPSWGLLKTIYR
jgi:hypothetical protein